MLVGKCKELLDSGITKVGTMYCVAPCLGLGMMLCFFALQAEVPAVLLPGWEHASRSDTGGSAVI